MKPIPLASVLGAFLVLCSCAGRMAGYTNDPSNMLLDQGKTALCIPLDSLHVAYVDNTASAPDTLFNDSFFIEAANGLLGYEVSRNFKMCHCGHDGSDSLAVFRRSGYSRLDNDTTYVQLVSMQVRRLAAKYNADLVIVPYALEIKHVAIKPRGWRGDRFGPAYERPTSFTAKTSFHVQIWDKSGRLLYERVGKSDTGRPILYSMLKREKKPDKDIVKYARRIYAPPLVKSLYNSIKLALMVRI
jgi:hypothetical protein